MLSYEEFAEQDFFRVEDHIKKYNHVKSTLIYGDPCHKKISVVIPTYKRAHLLDEALQSCFQQTADDFNIVISDNEPERNDETELLIKRLDDPRIIYYKNESNIGPLANFNRCIELSDCIYCVFLCSDDLLEKTFIGSALKFLDNRNDVDMLLPQKNIQYPKVTYRMKGYCTLLRKFEGILGKHMTVKLKPVDFLIYYPAGGPSGIVYKKTSFMEIGGFNPLWHPTGDYILHFLMTIKKNAYLTSIDSGEYRMLENISSEKDMRSVYIIQNYLIRKAFTRTDRGYFWVDPCFRGSVFRWLKLNLFVKSKDIYNMPDIKKYIKSYTIFNYIFYLMIWFISFVFILFRVRIQREK